MMTETVVNVQDAPPNSNAANKQSERHGLEWIKINVDYFRTLPGILKLVQFLFGIICMSLATPHGHGSTHWFLLVATVSFIATLIWIFIYFLGIREATANYPINWILTELLNTGICTICYFIAFICQLVAWVPDTIYNTFLIYPSEKRCNIAAGVFGIFQTVLYGLGTFLLYLESKRS